MKYLICLFVLCSQLSFAADFWGKTGHRVVGEVASEQLNRKARKAITKLLDGQTVAEVSTYADDIKSDDRYDEFYPWHYVNYPLDATYGDVPPAEQGDVVKGIQTCMRILQDENRTKADKAFYLKMLIHLVGDLHQPLHVGRSEDKGGNDLQVRWFNKGSNLHRVWDTHMIEDYGMSYTELATTLPAISKKKKKALAAGDVLDWVEESQDLAKKVYDGVKPGQKLGYGYSYEHWNTVEEQLLKGGLRLGKILNQIFG